MIEPMTNVELTELAEAVRPAVGGPERVIARLLVNVRNAEIENWRLRRQRDRARAKRDQQVKGLIEAHRLQSVSWWKLVSEANVERNNARLHLRNLVKASVEIVDTIQTLSSDRVTFREGLNERLIHLAQGLRDSVNRALEVPWIR